MAKRIRKIKLGSFYTTPRYYCDCGKMIPDKTTFCVACKKRLKNKNLKIINSKIVYLKGKKIDVVNRSRRRSRISRPSK